MKAPLPTHRFQAGFSLVTAIFLLVILAALGAFMVTISTSQQMSSAMDLQGSRAYRAARGGAEWAAATLCNGSPCANPLTACFTDSALTIDGFSVHVSCAMNSYPEAGMTTANGITDATYDGASKATLTISSPHGFSVGQNVTVIGVTSSGPASFNGNNLSITDVDAPTNTFKYLVAPPGNPGTYATSGEVYPPRYVITAVASCPGAAAALTTSAAHGLVSGQLVTITNATTGASYGTDLPAAVTGATTFTVPLTFCPIAGDLVYPPRYVFWIESTASSGGAPGNLTYIERTINSLIGF